MKVTKKQFISILLVICMLVTGGCGAATITGASDIVTVVSNFEYSCRNLDLDGMLQCINPDVADPVKFILDIFMWFTKSDETEVVGDIMESVFDNKYDIQDLFDDITFEKPNVKIRGNEATAEYTLVYVLGSKGLKEKAEELQEELDELQKTAGSSFIPDELLIKNISTLQSILSNADKLDGYKYYEGLDAANEFKNSEEFENTNIGEMLVQLKQLEKIEIPVTFLMKYVGGAWYIAGLRLGTVADMNNQP